MSKYLKKKKYSIIDRIIDIAVFIWYLIYPLILILLAFVAIFLFSSIGTFCGKMAP